MKIVDMIKTSINTYTLGLTWLSAVIKQNQKFVILTSVFILC